VSLCVLDERWPFSFLQVYADAVIDRDPELVTDVMMAVGWRMSGQQAGEEARPFVREMAEREDRLVIRCRPYATFATPPRHLYAYDEASELTHWGSASVAWNSPDPVVREMS
jgi:hypothetical protein